MMTATRNGSIIGLSSLGAGTELVDECSTFLPPPTTRCSVQERSFGASLTHHFALREMEILKEREDDFVSVTSTLNCIDLLESDLRKSVSLLKQACKDSGFFYVLNHGISPELVDEVFSQSRKFFSLPTAEKMALLKNEKHRGYTPMFDEILDPENQLNGDYKEGYYIGREVPESDPQFQNSFYGPNQWPDEDLLPGWRASMERYHQEALAVGKRVARILAVALDLDFGFFDGPEMLGEAIATLRLLHYEGQASDPSKGLYGAGAHTDYGLVTLLAVDEVGGLQICRDAVWEYVPPLKGALIVNVGDMLERWSNGIFKSTMHRVLLENGRDRFSVAYFLEPSHGCLVECLPTCTSPENPPKFPPIRCDAYLAEKYRRTHTSVESYASR